MICIYDDIINALKLNSTTVKFVNCAKYLTYSIYVFNWF